MTSDEPTRLLWVDTETTGLGADARILEIGAIVTEADLTPVAALHSLFYANVAELQMTEYVWKMHRDNGLLAEIEASEQIDCTIRSAGTVPGVGLLPGFFWDGAPRIESFDAYFADFIRIWCPGVPLAGSSIGFDRRMMQQAGLAMSLSLLHYRNFDVSTLREAISRWAPGRDLPPKSYRHRVFDDLAASLASARVAKDLLSRDGIGDRALG